MSLEDRQVSIALHVPYPVTPSPTSHHPRAAVAMGRGDGVGAAAAHRARESVLTWKREQGGGGEKNVHIRNIIHMYMYMHRVNRLCTTYYPI